MIQKLKDSYKTLGPGLLAAGAAIGVSHLVQSTRAGAEFGYQLIWVVLIANFMKYPFFEIAPRYTASTGHSLLHGYKKIGSAALWLVFLMTVLTMFTIQAAVTIVTAGLAIEIFQLPLDAKIISSLLLVICSVLLLSGKYVWLDRFGKAIVLLLSVTTIFSVFGAFGIERTVTAERIFDWSKNADIIFLIALAGWMPAPLDLSIWHSLWIEEKINSEGQNLKNSLFDFRVGYVGTIFLAICFLFLGSKVMYGSGIELSASAGGFAAQLIQLYTSSLGSWAYPLIALAAFTTMFSTTVTCLDAFPRVLGGSLKQLNIAGEGKNAYRLSLIAVVVGTIIVFYFFMANMKSMVMFATVLSFVLAPIYAILNHLVMVKADLPEEQRLGSGRKALHYVLIVCMLLFSAWFLMVR